MKYKHFNLQILMERNCPGFLSCKRNVFKKQTKIDFTGRLINLGHTHNVLLRGGSLGPNLMLVIASNEPLRNKKLSLKKNYISLLKNLYLFEKYRILARIRLKHVEK